MNKHFLLLIVILFITTLNISALSQTNQAGILEGTWEVIAMKDGDMDLVDELMGRELHIVFKKNMIFYREIRYGNIVDEQSEKFEIINNIIQFGDGTSVSYTVERNILTIEGLGADEGKVVICRKLK
jgi:hypothetical protein